MKLKSFIKKNWGNLFIVVVIALLLIPQTGMPVKVFFSRLIAFSPSEIATEKQNSIQNYNWILDNEAGERVNFSNSKGKVTLVNFWATWCPPCVAEMPSLQNLFDEYGGKVDFYFVSMESHDRVDKFKNKKGYDFPNYRPKEQVPTAIQSYSLPTTFVISKSGKIVVKKSGAANWDSDATKQILETLLAE